MQYSAIRIGLLISLTAFAAPVFALVSSPTAVPIFDGWSLVGLSVAVAAAAYFVKRRGK